MVLGTGPDSNRNESNKKKTIDGLPKRAPKKHKRAPLRRRTQEGCGGLGGENPAAFPKARPIFQQPFSLPESAQTLAEREREREHFVLPENRGIIFQQRRNLPENLSSKEFQTATAFLSFLTFVEFADSQV